MKQLTFGEIGDSVRSKLSHIYNNPTMVIQQNIVFKSVRNRDAIVVVNDDGDAFTWNIENIQIIPHIPVNKKDTETENEIMTQRNKSIMYAFNSISKADIDWSLILADLTRKNSIALVTIPREGVAEAKAKAEEEFRKTERKNYQILKKQCEEDDAPVPEREIKKMTEEFIVSDNYVVIHPTLRAKALICQISLPEDGHNPKADVFKIRGKFGVWVDWAKRVKQTPWPADYHNKVKVTVIQPKI